MRTVTLITEQGEPLAQEEIWNAHSGDGKLHLAFSVYVFRANGAEILLQRRSAEKPLFKRIWANTCCSHQYENEANLTAGMRRLPEECGFSCPLTEVGSIVYKARDPENRGTEHEYDVLLMGMVDDVQPIPNPAEIEEMKWVNVADLRKDMEENPSIYAPWFHLGLPKVLAFLTA